MDGMGIVLDLFPAAFIWAPSGPTVGVKPPPARSSVSMAQMAEMKHFEATLQNLGSSIQKSTQNHML